jgi:hypothetical protein
MEELPSKKRGPRARSSHGCENPPAGLTGCSRPRHGASLVILTYGLHDGEMVAARKGKPFKKRGKFNSVERAARAKHEVGKRFKKVPLRAACGRRAEVSESEGFSSQSCKVRRGTQRNWKT